MKDRKKQRLPGFDYSSPGAYFVTICVQDMRCCLGDVINGEMILNDSGRIVQTTWLALPDHYPDCVLDSFIIMPNHVHGIIRIVGNGFKPFPTEME